MQQNRSKTAHAVLLCGSPNPQGSTMALLKETERGLREAGAQVSIVSLTQLTIGACRGCFCCDTGPCVQQDDMTALLQALTQADVIGLGAPSYWGDVPAQVKVFIDRCLPVCDTRPAGAVFPRGKAGITLSVRAGRSVAESYHVLGTIEHFFGHLGIEPVSRIHAEGVSSPADLTQESLHGAYLAGLHALRLRQTPQFHLREATDADIPPLADLNRTLIADEGSDNPMTLEQLQERMADFLRGEYRAVIIEVEGEAAGYCLFRPQENGVYVRQYIIKPQHRMLGLGKAAFLSIKTNYLDPMGSITLDVLQGNAPGLAFWRSVGFTPRVQQMVWKGSL